MELKRNKDKGLWAPCVFVLHVCVHCLCGAAARQWQKGLRAQHILLIIKQGLKVQHIRRIMKQGLLGLKVQHSLLVIKQGFKVQHILLLIKQGLRAQHILFVTQQNLKVQHFLLIMKKVLRAQHTLLVAFRVVCTTYHDLVVLWHFRGSQKGSAHKGSTSISYWQLLQFPACFPIAPKCFAVSISPGSDHETPYSSVAGASLPNALL
eukprot:1154321-Pelagomonas_calceolata.AAC.2